MLFLRRNSQHEAFDRTFGWTCFSCWLCDHQVSVCFYDGTWSFIVRVLSSFIILLFIKVLDKDRLLWLSEVQYMFFNVFRPHLCGWVSVCYVLDVSTREDHHGKQRQQSEAESEILAHISAGLIQEVGCERVCVEYRCGRPASTCPDLQNTFSITTGRKTPVLMMHDRLVWSTLLASLSKRFNKNFFLRLLILDLQVFVFER